LCAERKIDAIYTTLPPFSSMFVGHDLRLETGLPCGSPITATSGGGDVLWNGFPNGGKARIADGASSAQGGGSWWSPFPSRKRRSCSGFIPAQGA
jgi:hypothetical protein